MTTITEPGVYYDLPAATYHAQHDWLSWSGAKHLIPPNTPAHFKAAQGAGEARKRHFDLGKVVHTLALGDGDVFEVVQTRGRDGEMRDADGYTNATARQHRDEIYDRGNVPILRTELDTAIDIATAIREHPAAAALLTDGYPEVSLFWIDEDTGTKCRARLDWMPTPHPEQPFTIADIKTTDRPAGASPTEFAATTARLGYYGQETWYRDGIRALGIHPDPDWVFIVVETTAPHLVQVGRYPDPDDQHLARAVVDHTRRLYTECTASGVWPGYSNHITDLELPAWLRYRMEDSEVIEADRTDLKL